MEDGILVATVAIAYPGKEAVAGELRVPSNEVPKFDDLAIHVHGLVNDIIMSIRAGVPVINGEEQG